LILRPGQSLDLKALQAYMAENKVAKQYWPERVEIVAEMPKTPAGKIQKFQLPEQAKAFGDVTPNAPRERTLERVYVIAGVARGEVFSISIAEQFVREDAKAGLRRPRRRL
jgi:hypothetical protein